MQYLLIGVVGFFQCAAGLGLLLPHFRRPAGWILALVVLVTFPANAHLFFEVRFLPRSRESSWLACWLACWLAGWLAACLAELKALSAAGAAWRYRLPSIRVDDGMALCADSVDPDGLLRVRTMDQASSQGGSFPPRRHRVRN